MVLLAHVRSAFALSNATYGSPRMTRELQEAGLRLVAADLDWSHGSGPEVTGTGEALLMVIAGRPAALAELGGSGAPELTRRVLARR